MAVAVPFTATVAPATGDPLLSLTVPVDGDYPGQYQLLQEKQDKGQQKRFVRLYHMQLFFPGKYG
jgi:hypothetical protein